MKEQRVPIAKEGYPFIFFSAFATLSLALISCNWVVYIGLVLTAFILYFFRDPERITPDKDNIIVSPADGKVIQLDEPREHPVTGTQSYKISIFMNVFNVHVNRLPCSGEIHTIQHTPGKFYSADSVKGMDYNENCATVIETSNGMVIGCVQVAGLIARRIVNWLELGEHVSKGERFGLIRFGSRVDVYLPAGTSVAVELGQKVRAGETPLGYLDMEKR